MRIKGGERNKQINLRMSGQEMARLSLLAKHYGLSPIEVLRMLVKLDFAKHFASHPDA
jgi:hypothetical protein